MGALIGYAKNADEPNARQVIEPLRSGLRQRGWTEQKDLEISFGFGAGDINQTKAAAAELVAQKPDLIYAIGLPGALSAHALTQTIPIVFTQVADPVGFGLVSTLAKPSGNATGFTSWDLSIGGKWLELLREIAPATQRIIILYNPDTARYGPGLFAAAKLAAGSEVDVAECAVHDLDEIERSLISLAGGQPCGLIATPEPFVTARQAQIIEIAARLRLPLMMPLAGAARRGALISYTYSTEEILQLPIGYIDRILRGEAPGDLPVQSPSKYELAVNLKTAGALGLNAPNSLLASADEIID